MGKKTKRTKKSVEVKLCPGDQKSNALVALDLVMNNLSLKDENKCTHGRPNLPAATLVKDQVVSDDICSRFMFHFEMGLNASFMLHTFGTPTTHSGKGYPHPFELYASVNNILKAKGLGHLWDDESTKETLSACLLSVGTELLLSHHIEIVKGGKRCYLEMAGAVIVAYLKVNEGIDPSVGMTPSQVRRMRDLMGGGVDLWVRFFAKRVKCSCLKDETLQRNLLTSGPTEGVCRGCEGTRKRRDLLICTRCKVCHYCSRECSRADWPRHKKECANYAANPHALFVDRDS